MRKSMIGLAVALALAAGACGQDVTESDEYQTLEQQLVATEVELAEAQAATLPEVPAEVLAFLDEWWAANERDDGSVTDLYTVSGYHLYGDEKISRNDLAAHLNTALSPEWITEPYLIVADRSRGRYVVTRGMRSGTWASALTFEIVAMADGELKLAQTAWTYAH
jgi:hypothetical protein